jgi:hypothetical protein
VRCGKLAVPAALAWTFVSSDGDGSGQIGT